MFRPMLAANAELSELKYPVLCTPKFDGIRCVIRGGVALSRKLKPIPNLHVQALLQGLPEGLDGELLLDHKTFNQIQSAVMSEDGTPDVSFHVFDIVGDAPYRARMEQLRAMELPEVCKKVLPVEITNEADLLEYERETVEEWEMEGVMVRSPEGPYKYGRSTTKQGYLLKIKRFQDAEAEIVGFDELEHNLNEATTDALGLTKRTTHKAGKVGGGVLGAFVVRKDGQEFRVATGLTMQERADYWADRENLVGKLLKFKYQEAGKKDLPRFPVFLGFRHPDDL